LLVNDHNAQNDLRKVADESPTDLKDANKPEVVDKMMPGEDPERRARTNMDPQCQKYLNMDIKRVKEAQGSQIKDNGLLSFNRFMHLFMLLTRHSKE
jgi:hypothetical protein